MIGVRFTPHHSHSLAVLVRVVAAMVFIASAVLIPLSVAGIALHHVGVQTALMRVAIALGLTVLTFFVTRRLDPLRR